MSRGKVKPAFPPADFAIEVKAAYWTRSGFRAGFDSREEALLHMVAERAAAKVVQTRGDVAGMGYGQVNACVSACMPEIIATLEEAGFWVFPPKSW